MSETKIYTGKIVKEPTYQVLEETNESYFNLKIKDDAGKVVNIAIGGNVTNDFYQYRLGRKIKIHTEKINNDINKATKVTFLSKYLVQVMFKYSNKEYLKDFDTKLEIKEYIDDIANKNKQQEIAFFLYSIIENNKHLIGYLECNYGDWENYEFYKRGSEQNTIEDYFSWDIEPSELDINEEGDAEI